MYQSTEFYLDLVRVFGGKRADFFSEKDLLIALLSDVLFQHSGLASLKYPERSDFDVLGFALAAHEPYFFLNSTFSTLPINISFSDINPLDDTIGVAVTSNPDADEARVECKQAVGDWHVALTCQKADEDLFLSALEHVARVWMNHLTLYNNVISGSEVLNDTSKILLERTLSKQLKFNEALTYGNHLSNEFNNKNLYIKSLREENDRLMDHRSAGNRILDFGARLIRRVRDKTNKKAIETDSDNKAGDISIDASLLAKEEHAKRALGRLNAFLKSKDRISIGDPNRDVDVSVVLITWGRAELTFECIESLSQIKSPNIEVVVFDNASPDNTLEMLSHFDGNIQIVEHSENVGFLLGCNLAVEYASSDTILLLNNDTTLPSDAISKAYERLNSDENIGAVGGKIILPDGKLQEAGSFVWRHGGAQGYLRGADVDDPRGNFVRPVDFVSGAFLMTRRRHWEEIGGFDERFIPAYFEEVDYCLSLRGIGKHVVYDPSIIINHFEFASAKKKSDAISLQKRNRLKLEEKHREFLLEHCYPPDLKNVNFARTASLTDESSPIVSKKNVLFIDDMFPDPAVGSGFGRSHDMVDILSQNVRTLTLLPLNFPDDKPSNWRSFWGNRVEVLFGIGRAGFKDFIREWHENYDHIIVSRPHNIEFIKSSLTADLKTLISSKLIYDAEAIFTMRERAQAAVNGEAWPVDVYERNLARELKLALGINKITVVSQSDADCFKSVYPNANIKILAHACEKHISTAKFSERKDCLFVGSLTHEHSPNVDGVKELCKLWKGSNALTGINLNIVGSLGKSGWHKEYEAENIRFLGRVEDLTELYESHRVFIAPARYAAGVPIKVLEAMSRKIPCVISRLLGEQLDLQDGNQAVIRDLDDTMIQAIVEVHDDYKLWSKLRKNATSFIDEKVSREYFVDTLLSIIK